MHEGPSEAIDILLLTDNGEKCLVCVCEWVFLSVTQKHPNTLIAISLTKFGTLVPGAESQSSLVMGKIAFTVLRWHNFIITVIVFLLTCFLSCLCGTNFVR